MPLLSAKAVEKLMKKPGRHAVGPQGLYLQITGDNGRSWIYRYQRDGKQRHMGLGSAGLDGLSLEEAREKASDQRRLHKRQIDPLAAREAAIAAEKLKEARGTTFKECATRYIEANETAWKNEVHRKQWASTLEAYVYPIIGDLPVSSIDTVLVLKVLEQKLPGETKTLWASKPETASRVRGRIERVLDWAKGREFREGENPARWRGHLENQLPHKSKNRKVKHHKALPYNELGAFMARLRAKVDISAKALEFTILTAARTGETIGAQRSEIDMVRRVWTVPAERMKASKEHRVPLSDRAIEIIESLKHNEAFLFPGAVTDQPLSNMAMLEMVRGMSGNGLTVHGFRSTFMDWGHELTEYPKEMLDIALAHTVSDKVEAAYRRGDMFEKRQQLMADWGKYCGAGR
jgi:integrase